MKLAERIGKVDEPKKSQMDYLKSTSLGDDKDEVLCKLCGTQIMNEKAVRDKVKLVPNGMYTEITIEFKDGTAHETSICKDCAKKPLTDKLEFIYMSDMKQWKRETNIDMEHFNKEIKSYRNGSRVV